MKIKLLLNIGTNDAGMFPLLKEGEHDVSRDVGQALIARGWAVSLEPPAKDIKAVPPESSIKAATEKATADLRTYRERHTRGPESKSPANKEQ